ncbi:MAG: hypothetical protein ABR579_08945, partial [Actinomycetota bacterium]
GLGRERQVRPFASISDALSMTIEPDEAVLGEGRFDEASFENAQSMGYIVVTDKRILLSPTLDKERSFNIPLETIASFSEVQEKHRYYLHLRHDPIERRVWVSHFARRRTLELIKSRETFLRFSRRDTAAAKALRDVLVASSIERTEWSAGPPTLRNLSERRLARGREF